MADEFRGYACVADRMFPRKGKCTELARSGAVPDRSPGPPGPELRADVVDVANAMRPKLAREPKMKAGKIGEDREWRLAARRFGDKVAHGAHQRRKVLEDFGDANDGDFGIVGDDVNAGGAHLRAAHAEEGHVACVAAGPSRGARRTCLRKLRLRRVRSGMGGMCGRCDVNPSRAAEWVAGREADRRGGRRIPRGFRQAQFLFFVLELVEAVVDAALGEKFLMRALFAQAALVEDENAVGVLNGAQAMGDDERGAAGEQAVERFANQQLGFGVHAGGGFVENQEARIVRQRAGEADQLALADGKSRAALVDAGVHAFWQGANEIAEADFVDGALDGRRGRCLGVPRRTLDSSVPVKRNGSCRTMPNWRRRS